MKKSVCVTFVHRLRKRRYPWRWRLADRMFGSDVLRLQSIQHLTLHLADNVEVLTLGSSDPDEVLASLAASPPDVVILSKSAGYGIRPESVERLQAIGVRVGLDHKDGELSRSDFDLYDFHISASYAGLRAIESALRQTEQALSPPAFAGLLLQSPDVGLKDFVPNPQTSLSSVYVGAKSYAFIPAEIEDEVQILRVNKTKHMKRAILKLPQSNFHYAVRPLDSSGLWRAYKPFTKGMVAAACHSNILVVRDADDVLDYLPDDYPYLINSAGEDDVIEGFNKAKDEYGGATWNTGIEYLRASLEKVTPQSLARQFSRLVERAME